MGLLRKVAVGSIAGKRSAKRQFETMQASQKQQEQINQAQAQAAQAQAAAQAAQASNSIKKDPLQELERLGNLKQQGLITEEEFQKLKAQLLS